MIYTTSFKARSMQQRICGRSDSLIVGEGKKGRTAASQHLSAEKAEKMFFPKDVEGGIIPK